MQWCSPSDEATGLPQLLAEYGRLAAQLPGAEPGPAGKLRQRLRELDLVIDRCVADLDSSPL